MDRVMIKTVHVKNFRSIKDTKKIEINNKITVLAGKNESGKTNILKAIQAFYNDEFDEDDIPVDNKELNPEIKINFELSKEYINEKLKTKINSEKDKFSLCITRSKNIIDVYEGTIIECLSGMFVEEFNKVEEYKSIFKQSESDKFIKNILNNRDEETELIENINKSFNISDDEQKSKEQYTYIKEVLKKLDLKKNINKLIPQIAYFDSFEDMLPDELTQKEIATADFEKNNKAFVNLLKLLNINKDEFLKKIEGNERNQSSEFKSISKKITEKYNNVYLQEKVSIGLDKNGDKIFIQIFDEGDLNHDKKPSQRSNGFQWFISFYLLLNSLDKDAIILIDEPGLYLHAKAQDDILKFLNEEIDNNVIFTTHSPYLIDINKLDSLKLIRKIEKLGTIVDQKYYDCKDQETITPVVTAIGYNVAKNPIGIGNGLNIITEGISDRFYILAFLDLLKSKDNINIIPSTGAGNIHLLVSLAIGWNLNYKILLDKDTGEGEAISNLKKLFIEEEQMYEKIVYACNKGAIEDVFSKDDKKKFNISKNRKVVSAYNFYNKVVKKELSIKDLSQDSINNIKAIVEKLK